MSELKRIRQLSFALPRLFEPGNLVAVFTFWLQSHYVHDVARRMVLGR